ncbi:MAG TPA: DUF4229 domain-containing protein [Trebonia sp.]|jgi:hypothetical protein|nr:DUF4229 domain-containing protein [Trebonia sp.]
MRTTLAYTSARILLFVAALVVIHLAGAQGWLLILLALLVSGLASYILLSRQRDKMSAALSGRLTKAGTKAAEFRSRLDEGAAAEDVDDDEPLPGSQPPGAATSSGATPPTPPATITPS